MSYENFDDGLVHSHSAWCSERGAALHAQGREDGTDSVSIHPEHLEHDDGLVHDHAWACGERGRMDPAR